MYDGCVIIFCYRGVSAVLGDVCVTKWVLWATVCASSEVWMSVGKVFLQLSGERVRV